MLTIKQITENTEAVIRGLEKKHFKNAKETIEQVIALNDKRRSTQNQLDKNLAEVNSLSRTIGQLMKEGKKEEAETARARVLGRKVALSGRSLENVVAIGTELGYLHVPDGLLVSIDMVNRYPADQMVIITTGSQGEPMSALTRMQTPCSEKSCFSSSL